MVSVEIAPEFGYVVLVVFTTYILNAWMIYNVVKMRKSHKIFYPVMTSDKHPEFNCRQRVHQNTCLLYTSPSPRDRQKSRMPSSA